MFEYKNEQSYSDFFSSQADLQLIKPFEKIDKKKKDNPIYVGEFVFLNTIHDIRIRVEIPFNFPHAKMTFYTASLCGYPHLIKELDNNNKESWFCLNSPFAETAEAQLEVELSRLREWINKYIRKDLPAIIEDKKVIAALRKANTYSWEKTDEIAEYHDDAVVTFLGNFAKYAKNFKENKGKFYCIKNGSNRFTVIKNKELSNYEIPYIIVDECPVSSLKDFITLRNLYKWDKDVCEFLLPNFKSDIKGFFLADYSSLESAYNLKELNKPYSKEDALCLLYKAEKELMGSEEQISIVRKEIEKLKAQIVQNNGYSFGTLFSQYDKKPNETEDEYQERLDEQYAWEDYCCEIWPYSLSYFFLGIQDDNGKIIWLLCATNRNAAKYEENKFDLALKTIYTRKLKSWDMWINTPIYITENQYFGRGSFSHNFCDFKIALIGVGALGSTLADSLVRSGVKNLGIWDNDIVEYGNICRSIYDIRDIGESKVAALKKRLEADSPNVNVKIHGFWNQDQQLNNQRKYLNGDLYGNINYKSQQDVIEELNGYDLIIDCSASNELLHFLSYSIADRPLVSLCITNHSDNLILVSNSEGNPYELRKAILAKLVQDTKNFYHEGSGCYSPTFLALNCDIASLVQLAVREISKTIGKGLPIQSTIWSHADSGVIADRFNSYKLEGYDIKLFVSDETLLDGDDVADIKSPTIGYLFGCYSSDGKTIMLTHFVEVSSANRLLSEAYTNSDGIIDYIGDFCYALNNEGEATDSICNLLKGKAINPNINTNNPLLAVRTPDRRIKFYLLINNSLVAFSKRTK